MAFAKNVFKFLLTLFTLCDFGHGWAPLSLLFKQRLLTSHHEMIPTKKRSLSNERKLNIQSVTLFGEEVKEKETVHPKFRTKEEEGAHILNNSIDFDTKALPTINLQEELEEQKAKRTYMGEKDGIDDPRDCHWRLKAERIIKNCIKQESKVALYDITWNIADLNVVIEPLNMEDGDSVDLKLITSTARALEAALEHFEVIIYIYLRM